MTSSDKLCLADEILHISRLESLLQAIYTSGQQLDLLLRAEASGRGAQLVSWCEAKAHAPGCG